ncbi:MAG: SDR family NAD(P)-dependent oxidoreductase [bacterium]
MSGAEPSTSSPLAGRHAVVTGGGRGIGAAIARELAALGARLTLMGRTQATLDATAASLREGTGAEVDTAVVDLTRPEAIEAAFAKITEEITAEITEEIAGAGAEGGVSILVNNAGTAASSPLMRETLEQWEAMMALNATAAFLCCRAVLPAMTEAGEGRIVNVASTAGLKGYAYVGAYCASKHALIGMTRALALETARVGITVNAVCPGYTETDMLNESVENITRKTGRTPEEAKAALASHNPQGRLIQPEEVARMVGWLCLPGQGSVTGQSLVIAGGEVM